MATAQDAKAEVSQRVEAVDQIWASASSDRERAREELKRLAWQPGGSPPVRMAAIDKLIADPGDVGHADSRAMLRLMLPVELNAAVRQHICEAAARHGWTDLTPAIVRSWARTDVRDADAQRPERAALTTLYPGVPVERVVWSVFSAPIDKALTGYEADRAERARAAAWEVLGRIDPTGAARGRQLAAAGPAVAGEDPLMQAAQACASDLRCVPVTGEQLQWAASLRDFANVQDGERRRAWWSEATRTVQGLDTSRTGTLHLRNIEAIRWAGRYKPEWLSMSQADLYDALRARLSGRLTIRRTAHGSSNTPNDSETLADNRSRLSWGDLVTVLVIDEAVQSGLYREWQPQIERDFADKSTEYGGLIESDPAGNVARFNLVLYPPRPTERFGDDRFVASQDMLSAGGWALAQYHFHASKMDNREYAGPGGGDMQNALTLGRANVVVTPIGDGRMDVDYYQNTGGVEARVDLGVVGGK